jgi:hypothetical protein
LREAFKFSLEVALERSCLFLKLVDFSVLGIDNFLHFIPLLLQEEQTLLINLRLTNNSHRAKFHLRPNISRLLSHFLLDLSHHHSKLRLFLALLGQAKLILLPHCDPGPYFFDYLVA